MIRCKSCGCENRPEALFCAGCGAALPTTVELPSAVTLVRCSACGQDNPPQASFCAACGASLSTTTRLSAPSEAPDHRAVLSKWIVVGVIALLAVIGIGYGLMSLLSGVEKIPPAPKEISSRTLIYQDDFSNPDSGWLTRTTGKADFGQENGEYHFRLTDPGLFFVWNPRAGQFTDFALEVDTRMASGANSTGYGMLFRLKDSNNFYRFIVFGDGSYIVGKKANGTWTELQRWTKAANINKGNITNHLKVVCQGSLIEASVNGYHLTDIRDDSFTEGFVGMFVGTREPDVHVAFDNIRVYKLD